MLYEAIFCFFTVFGIMQILSMIKDFCITKIPRNVTMVVGIDESTNIEVLEREICRRGTKIVFVYGEVNAKKLEILKRKFEYASFVKREKLSDEMLKLI